MKLKIFFILVLILNISLSIYAEDKFKCIETWKHDIDIYGNIRHSMINNKGEIIGDFYKTESLIIAPKKVIKFAPRGQGPGDLVDIRGMCEYKKDLAIIELPNKIKIFKRKDNKYVWKKTQWLERSKFLSIVKSGVFAGNKWFVAGKFLLNYSRKYIYKKVHLKVFDKDGNLLKTLIKETTFKPDQLSVMDYYVLKNKENVLFLAENKLNVKVISIDKLEIVNNIDLSAAKFYKKMPEDFYIWKKYNGNFSSALKDWDMWKTSYSRIIHANISKNWLVLQIRCFKPQNTKFALLFYNTKTFKLERTILINDRLLGIRDGKYYFYANGDPKYDEEADECIIKIYSFCK